MHGHRNLKLARVEFQLQEKLREKYTQRSKESEDVKRGKP